MDTIFTKAQVGDVIGPYEQGGSMRVAKVIGKGPLLSVRHILIGGQKEDSIAVAKAQKTVDSLMPMINAENFEEYVVNFSDDHQPDQPVANGGKYENFVGGEMVTEFEEFAKEKPVGTIDYVQTQFGFHIIEVLDREDDAVPSLAVVQRTLLPSTVTINDAETNAYDVLDKMYSRIGKVKNVYKKVEKFDTLAKRADMIVRTLTIADDSPKINGFTSEFAENEIFRLAYQEGAEIGDLISSPVKDGERWVVAVLADIKEKGDATFENVRRTVETEYMKDKKFKKILSQMAKKSMQELEGKDNVTASNAEVVLGRSNLGPSSREPLVIGAIFSGLSDGKMTQPLKGTAGVYVVKIEKSVKAPETTDFSTQRNQLLATRRTQVQSSALNALKDMSEVIDNRRFSSIRVRN
jgi:peptidyl-prolyl cis-trans isomerase D